MTSITSYFKSLGAPLNSHMWSWGASNDDYVILRVWYDETPKIRDFFCPLVFVDANREGQSLGEMERARHIEEIRNGKPCYLVMCRRDKTAKQNEITKYDRVNLRIGEKLFTEVDGNVRIKIVDKIGVMDFRKRYGILPKS